jgi:hypothetical protein
MKETEKNNLPLETELKDAIKKRRVWLLLNGVFLLVCLGLAAAIYMINLEGQGAAIKTKLRSLSDQFGRVGSGASEVNQPNLVRRAIDGVMVEPDKANLAPVAIMIENYIDSRPSVFLAKANLVYEAEAEGGVTRFLALYASGEKLAKIGPIRSARPYYVDWAEEFDAVYVHCGGSPEALVKIIKDDVIDMNEFYNGGYFWREPKRSAPHNIFTSSDNLYKYQKNKNLAVGNFLSWQYKDEAVEANRPEQASTTIYFPGPDYVVAWQYNKKDNDYVRYLAGEIHVDEDGSIIKAKNIVIQYVPAIVLDEKLRLEMKTIGSGQAIVCLDGICQKGIWKKNNESARTRFYYENVATNPGGSSTVVTEQDNEVKFNAGTTWIEVVRPEIEVGY